MDIKCQEMTAAMFGLPSLRPFQHLVTTELSYHTTYHLMEPNTTLVLGTDGSGQIVPATGTAGRTISHWQDHGRCCRVPVESRDGRNH